ncbi:hypothetical protein Bhyg_08775 [Pseudolycoriella hygida]|uniref:Uncharacterized protein n=1 Tax=Pseudolycoriella hygida TaxID=35572 RepID=A0A9Q0S551_9DIPT|nr:hypothetical protein Bhyg_08775 [Pseudolycoriella hygida]
MLCSTLTVIVLGLLAIVCFGLDYFVPQGHEGRFSTQWMKGTTITLLVVSMVEIVKNCSSYFTRRYKQKQFRPSRILEDLIPELRYNKIEWTVKLSCFYPPP